MSSERNGNGTRLYGWIVAVGVLCVCGIGLVLAFAPEQAPLLGTLITGFGLALIGQLFNAQKLTKIEDKAVETAGATAANAEKLDATDGRVVKMGEQLDGRLEKLLKAVEEAAFARGQVQEKEKAAETAAAVAVETAATVATAATAEPSKPAESAPMPPATIVNVEEMKVEADQVSIDQKGKQPSLD